MPQIFTAVSNYDRRGQLVSFSGLPGDTQEFQDFESARDWLRKQGGGAVSFYDETKHDFRSVEVTV